MFAGAAQTPRLRTANTPAGTDQLRHVRPELSPAGSVPSPTAQSYWLVFPFAHRGFPAPDLARTIGTSCTSGISENRRGLGQVLDAHRAQERGDTLPGPEQADPAEQGSSGTSLLLRRYVVPLFSPLVPVEIQFSWEVIAGQGVPAVLLPSRNTPRSLHGSSAPRYLPSTCQGQSCVGRQSVPQAAAGRGESSAPWCVCTEGLKRGLRRRLLELALGSDIHSELVLLEMERMDRQFT